MTASDRPHQKKLKVAILIRSFTTSGGGAERYAVSLAKEISRRHEVHIFAQVVEHTLINGMTFHRIKITWPRPRWINQLWFAIATQIAIQKNQFDIIHSHDMTWLGNVQTAHVVPVKYNLFHQIKGTSKILRWLKVITSPRLLTYLGLEKSRFNLKKKKTIIATSEALLQQIEEQYPHLYKKVKIVPPGVNRVPHPISDESQESTRSRFSLPALGKCVLFVANDFHRKGLSNLIKVLPLLPQDYYLAIVGKDNSQAKYRELAKELGTENRLFFLGSQSDMRSVYRCATCLAHPTSEDTFAMVVLEAFACSIPVVVSGEQYCGISRLLANEQEALLLSDPKDEAALRDAIIALCESPIRTQLIDRGLAFASHYLWENIAQIQENIYLSLVEEPH